MTVAEPDLVVSATLVAVTVTVCVVLIVAGAVYRPALDSVPTGGLRDQVTFVLLDPVTMLVNCCVCEAERLVEVGVTCTAAVGTTVRVAMLDRVGSAMLVAVT